jgi:predicted PurR-regulated permease PerM
MTMSKVNITEPQKRALTIATAIAVVVAIFFLKQYFSLFVVAAILGYLFNPVYVSLNRRFTQNGAAALTLLAAVLIVVTPLTLAIIFATGQLAALTNDLTESVSPEDLSNIGQSVVDSINRLLGAIPFTDFTVTEASLTEAVKTAVQDLGDWLFDYLTGLIGSIASLFTTLIIFIFIFFSLIKNGPMLLGMVRQLNPLGGEMTDLYIKKIGAMVRGTVQGQFIIAACQGLLTAITFALIGFPELFFVVFLITTVLSIIPLGAGILLIPIGIGMILFGNISGGLIVILEHLLINTNIDNILRPKLVPLEARLDSALMLVSVFSGMAYFGFLGIVIGPTLMIVIVTTVRVYLEVQKGYKLVAVTDDDPTIFRRISNFGGRILKRN